MDSNTTDKEIENPPNKEQEPVPNVIEVTSNEQSSSPPLAVPLSTTSNESAMVNFNKFKSFVNNK